MKHRTKDGRYLYKARSWYTLRGPNMYVLHRIILNPVDGVAAGAEVLQENVSWGDYGHRIMRFHTAQEAMAAIVWKAGVQ